MPNPSLNNASTDTCYTRTPFPWLIEEDLGGGRLVRRCSELAGGCGDRQEVIAIKDGPCAGRYPGFVHWYGQHCQCGRGKVARS